MTEKTISPADSKSAAPRTSDAPVQLIVATPLNNTAQFKLPIDAQQVQSVQSVDLDLVITTVTGEKIILQQGALQAALQPHSQIVFSNGKSITAADQIKKIGVLKPVEGGSFRLRSEDVTPTQADNVSGKEFGLGQDVNDAVKQLNETAQQIEKMLQNLSTASTTVSDSKNAMPQGQGPGTGFKKASDAVANPLASPTPGSPPVPENTNTSEQSGKDRELRASSEYKVTNVTLSDATKTLDAIQPRQMMAEAPLKVELKSPTTGSAEVKPQWADGVVQNTLLLSGAPTAIKAVYSLAQGTTSVPADFKINGQSLVDKPLELVVKGGATQHLDLTWKVAEDGATVQKTDFQVIVKYYNAAGTLLETGGQTLTFSYGDFRSVSETYANDANGQPIFNLLARGVSYDIQGDDKLNDVINAGDGHDIVRGFGGNDAINGGRGDDTLIGGMGADKLDGGTGTNTASYITSTTGVTVHTASAEQGLNAGGEAQGDVLSNIQNLVGSDFADALWGDSRANMLVGGKGDDTLDGGSGADQLIGGEGNNTASYASAQAGVTASLLHPENNTGDAAGDKYTDIQNLLGSAQADTLTGDAHDNVLSGGAGDDKLQGGVGKDTLDGGDGQDTASYADSTDAVKVSLQDKAINEGGDAQGDVLVNIEHLLGSAYDDQLTGNAQANMLNGGLGNDTLEGAGGADHLDGGAGTNTASYVGSSQGVTVYLAADRQLDNQGGDAQGDAFTNIQNLLGSAYADTLVGDEKNNSLSGGAGDDTLEGSAGGDVFDGGTGSNTVTYVHSAMGVSVYLGADQQIYNSGPDASGDTFKNIQNLIGTEKNDVLVGDEQSNLLQGGGGDDVLEGGLGADTLQGGEGHDTVSYENATQGVTASLGSPAQNVAEAAGDTYTSIENLRGTQFNDSLTGDASDNTLQGLAGNDTLDGGGGINNLIGGTGDDTYIISNVADTIVENINEGKDQVSSSVTYTLGSNLENLTLTGSAAINGTGNGLANVIIGNSADNTLDGAAGADTLVGGAGNDTYVVDDAGDVITENAGEGKDLVQSSFTYTLAANLENLTLTGNAAINGTGNADDNAIKGNNADNTLDGAAGNDNISGNDGNDKLLGGDGNDALDGGDGNDTLDGGAALTDGRNVLSGGAGDDTYIISNTSDEVSEGAGQGNDEVQSSVAYILGGNIEKLTLTGTANIDGTGNSLDNTITGNSGNNALNGGDGKDTINGGAGNDTLDGGAGEDSLVGGAGDDTYLVDSTSDVIVEVANEGSDTVKSSATYTLGDNIENLTLNGSAAIDGTGNSANNTITGNSADNTLDGGAGTDNLIGGDGNDTYVVDSTTDTITETTSGGTADLVKSSVTFSLAAINYVENLTLTGTATIDGTGNGVNNTINGNSADNTLDGGAGTDNLIGGDGNDTYVVDTTTDTITETASGGTADLVKSSVSFSLAAINYVENLSLTGNAAINGTGNGANNTITGNGAANTLDGGGGTDTLMGGDGNDTYVVDSTSDTITETTTGGTADLVKSSVTFSLATISNVENLTLIGTAAIDGTGNGVNNTITGNSADNTLDGGAGTDNLIGGDGNDTYVVDSTTDTITETTSGGTADLVKSSVTFSLAAINYVENLTLTGTTAIDGTGNSANNTITGNSAANILDGGAGADTLLGGDGNDTYVVDSTTDTITETTSGGTADLVKSSVTFSLAAINYVENLTLTGTAAINGTGNGLNNVITGNSGDNILFGGGGADQLIGGGGNDTASYSGSSLAVSINLATGVVSGGDAQGDVLNGISNLIGSSNADSLTGDANPNTIAGGIGADIIDGGLGNDTVDYSASAFGVTVNLSLATAQLGVGDAAGDVLTSIEKVIGSGYADSLWGSSGNETLIGGVGNDTLYGSAGADTLNGGTAAGAAAGTDTVDYSASTAVVNVNLALATAFGGDAQGDILSNISNLTGSAFADTLTGTTAANVLSGGNGDDTIVGGGGADMLIGGDGKDSLTGGSVADKFDLATGNTSLAGDVAKGNGGGDTFIINAVDMASTSNLTGTTIQGTVGNAVGQVDTLQIQGTAGASIDLRTLIGHATGIDKIDLATDNVSSSVSLNSETIKSLVGLTGNSCVLTLVLGATDAQPYVISETGVYSTILRDSVTFYSDSGLKTQIAQVQYI